ncbi:unnamed protein product [Cylindrotheca closterium]|uniref:DUF6824 domain-containing protein n=1 Tax=Cylindrotheca closterium TaxID=2856 RepID=A0AAD2G5J5_9STRA|nr:unnamed protein product [Cylindrotheca closterium]
MAMASSLPNNPFVRQACLPTFNFNDQAKDKSIPIQFQMPRKNTNGDISKLEMKQTEDLLASEMNRLSVQERAKAFDDLHCVGEELRETPEMIQKSLAEFEEAVQKERNSVYEMAINQNRAYVEDPKFRLKFLRAKLYDIRKSVRQMMSFLEQKAKYFGDDKVAQEIGMSDLTEEDVQLMLSGLFHIQDGRDRKGRVILHMFSKKLGKCKAETFIRVCYYMWWNIMIALPEVESKGLVTIYHDDARSGDEFKMPGLSFILNAQCLSRSLPIRYSAMHYCLQTTTGNLGLNNTLLSLLMSGLPQYARVRTRIHYGSYMELQYRLQSHGIPISTLPVDFHGKIRVDILNLWFEKHLKESNQKAEECKARYTTPNSIQNVDTDFNRLTPPLADRNANDTRERSMEDVQFADQLRPFIGVAGGAASSREGVIIHPSETDVLFGKGYRLQLHSGNIRFREFLEQHKDSYEHTPRHRKPAFSDNLIQILIADGIRFLQRNTSDMWVETDSAVVKRKVSQYYRDFRKKELKERSKRPR